MITMLSEDGVRLLAELKAGRDRKLCIVCIKVRLGVDHWEALKRLRELILSGHVMCGWYQCSACGHVNAAALLRSRSRSFA